MTSSFRGEDIDRMKSRHREEMKYLSDENDDLYHREKQLQSDLQLHKESIDYTVRYKIDLEKALEEKILFKHELDRLKHEKDLLEQEKLEYKTKYNSLQEEIRLILFDRSKLEQKLTAELQEHLQEKQRSTDDLRKYRTEIELLNIKLGDAEARLNVLQTQNESLLISKDRNIKNEFENLTQRLNKIESDKSNDHNEISNQQPFTVLTSSIPLNNRSQYQYLNQTFPQQYNNENYFIENSRQIRSNTERIKSELDRLREDFDKLVSNYEPIDNVHHQTQLHTQIDTFRQFYEQEFRQRQLLMSKLTNNDHSFKNNTLPYTNTRLLKQELETSINANLAEQRLQTIPRQTSALLTINTTNNGVMSSIELLRKHYHV
jgi:hypothetical protein